MPEGIGRPGSDDLTKRYGDKTAVDGLSFVVESGTVTGFLGPNGAGSPPRCGSSPGWTGTRAGGFSLGMGQRLGVAAALLGQPQTVVLAYESRLITPGTPPADRGGRPGDPC